MDVVVQPALAWMSLNELIKDSGLFFPVDPGPSVRFATTHDDGFEGTDTCSRLALAAWLERAAGTF